MIPIARDELREFAQRFSHPLAGFDFVDSKRDATPRGKPVFAWFAEAIPASAHTLSYYFGVQFKEHDISALLFFRIQFDEAVLTLPDGRPVRIESFAPVGSGRWKMIDRESGPGGQVLPDPVQPNAVDGRPLLLVFIESETGVVKGVAIGDAIWNGRHLRWESPDRKSYYIPAELVGEIRPPFHEIGAFFNLRPSDRFDYWVVLDVKPGEPTDARRLVMAYLKRSDVSCHRRRPRTRPRRVAAK